MSHYTGLGFDPVPGNVESVRALAETLMDAAGAAGDAADRITHTVTASTLWQGSAADEFRRHSAEVPVALHADHQMMSAAADTLFDWASALADLQRQAEQHDRQARTLAARISDAQQQVEEWEIAVSVASTHTRSAAETTLATHRQALVELRTELDAVLDAARHLAHTHRAGADQTETRLRSLTHRVAVRGARVSLVTGIGDRIGELAAYTRQASVAAALVPAARRVDPPTGGLAAAMAALTQPIAGRPWTMRDTDP